MLIVVQVKVPEEQHEGLEDMSEVVVPLDGRVGDQREAAEELHPDDGVDEEQHPHQHADVRQGLLLGSVTSLYLSKTYS